METNRRNFIKRTSKTAAGLGLISVIPSTVWTCKPAPSDQLNVALIGTRSMGFGDLTDHLKLGTVNCVGLCDVDQNVLERRAADVEKKYSQKPKLYNDFRKLLEDKDIDAVIIGTPDHWHCLPMVYACEAGKDVYVEKPMANSIGECNVMVAAAKRYNRIVQVGQQQRSGSNWNRIKQLIRDGHIGKLRQVNIWANFDYGAGVAKRPDAPVPQGVDFDFWLGPAPQRTFNPSRFHGNWRMFWDYGGGLMTDWGVHLIDMALWLQDEVNPPKTIMASGSNLSFNDNAHETYDTTSVIYQMDDYIINWQSTAGTQNGPWNMLYGVAFVGDLGTIVADRSNYKIIPEWDDKKKAPKIEAEEKKNIVQEDHLNHVKNFVDCVKSRETTVCPPEIGRAVAIAAHSANIAVRSGENLLLWDDTANKFSNSEKASEYILPEYRGPWKLPKI